MRTVVVLAGLLFAFPAEAKEIVPFSEGYAQGTVVVKTTERKLYYVVGNGQALRYSVGVGRDGMRWSGNARIEAKHIRPAWQAPWALRGASGLAPVIPGGSPKNPMGAAALMMRGGEYAIHGTNSPGSIGGFVSAGCIRMHNSDIMDLYSRVRVGTSVVVLP